METIVFKEIPFHIDRASLMTSVRVKPGSRYADELEHLAQEAEEIARPKALYRAVYFDVKDDEHVMIDGILLKSRVLKINLEHAHRIFPFVATCGMELEEWSRSKDDIMTRFLADAIKDLALRSVFQFTEKHFKKKYHLEKTGVMTPGSLPDWPIEEQRPLFTILGDIQDAIGVRITRSLVIIPSFSVSGILFPTEVSFQSCQLCPREKCQGRRAPHDKGLYDRKYRRGSDGKSEKN